MSAWIDRVLAAEATKAGSASEDTRLMPRPPSYYYYYFLTLGTYNPEGDKKLKRKYKIGYDHQSVQFVAGKLSCKRAALKRCTKIEILWYRKLVSRASPVFSEIVVPRSSRR